MTEVSSGDVPAPLHLVETSPPAADWESVYRDHVVHVFRFVYARTGNRADAEDVTSTTFMRALPRLNPNVSTGEMRAYLRTTARTVLADLWSERHSVPTDVIDEDRDGAAGPRNRRPNPDGASCWWRGWPPRQPRWAPGSGSNGCARRCPSLRPHPARCTSKEAAGRRSRCSPI